MRQLQAIRSQFRARLVIPVTPVHSHDEAELDKVARCGFILPPIDIAHPLDAAAGADANALPGFSRRRHPRGSPEDSPGCGFACGWRPTVPPLAARDSPTGVIE